MLGSPGDVGLAQRRLAPAAPPATSMAVKFRRAFFLAARTDRAADHVPLPGCVPGLFPRTLPRRLPPAWAEGKAAAGKTPLVGWRASRSGHGTRTTVYPRGDRLRSQHLLPFTPQAPGTPSTRARPSNEGCLLRVQGNRCPT